MGLSFPSVWWWEGGGFQCPFKAKKRRKCFLILPNPGTHAHRTLPRCVPGHPEALEDSTASFLFSEWRLGREKIPYGRELGSHSWGLNSCVTCEPEDIAAPVWGPFSERFGALGKVRAKGL